MSVNGELLGLDVGQSHLTAVRLAEDQGKLVPLMVAEVPLPRGTLDPTGFVADPAALTHAVKDLRSSYELGTKHCVLGLPGGLISFQPLQRPTGVEGEMLLSSLRLELEPGLPYDSEEAQIAYQVLSPDVNGTDEVQDILAVACDRSGPLALAKAVSAGGLKVLDVLPEPCVLPRSTDVGMQHGELLLDIGALSSCLMLVRNGYVVYTQAIEIGSDHFTQALVQSGLGAGDAGLDAEKFKRSHSLIAPSEERDPHAAQRAAMRSVADSFTEGIYQVMTYDAAENNAGINRMALTGGGSLLSGLLAHFNQSLGIPVVLAAPNPSLAVDDPDSFARHATAYALAMTDSAEVDWK